MMEWLAAIRQRHARYTLCLQPASHQLTKSHSSRQAPAVG